MNNLHQSERLLVLPNNRVESLKFTGASRAAYRSFLSKAAAGMVLMDRYQAEHDSSYKQVVTYCVVTQDGMPFCYQRKGNHGRSELRRLRSLGIGGHVNEEDLCVGRGFQPGDAPNRLGELLKVAAMREIQEEIGLSLDPSWIEPGGVIYQPGGAGDYHVGVVFLAKAPSMFDPVRSDETEGGAFLPLADIPVIDLEPWSVLALHEFVAGPDEIAQARQEREDEIDQKFQDYMARHESRASVSR